MPAKNSFAKIKTKSDILSLVPTAVLIIDRDWNIIHINRAAEDLFRLTLKKAVGKKCYEVLGTEVCNTEQCPCRQAIKEDRVVSGETVSRNLGNMNIKFYGVPIKDDKGRIIGCSESIFDITEMKRLQEKVVQTAREIMEVSNPIVTVFDDVLALPVIGTLDSQRTQQIMEKLLQAVVDTQSRVVIIDITGVPVVDTQTATHLIKTANAVRLLGATAIVTGISPVIAQTLVTLGVDLSTINTRARMVDGIRTALQTLNKSVIDAE